MKLLYFNNFVIFKKCLICSLWGRGRDMKKWIEVALHPCEQQITYLNLALKYLLVENIL